MLDKAENHCILHMIKGTERNNVSQMSKSIVLNKI